MSRPLTTADYNEPDSEYYESESEKTDKAMVNLSCGKSCMKYLLFVINFLFFLLGAAAFGLGIWALVDKNKMNVLTKIGAENSNFDVTGLLESAAIALVIGGASILIVGFLGCWGAMKQSQCLLCLYSVILVLIVILEIAVIIIAAVFTGKVTGEMKGFLKENINTTYEGDIDTSEQFSLGVDFAQVYFQCCGIDNYQDFEHAVKWKAGSGANMTVPPTCCKLKNEDDYLEDQKLEMVDPNCPYNPTNTNSHWEEGCWDSIESYMKARARYVIGIASAIVVFEIICIIFACCILAELRKGDN